MAVKTNHKNTIPDKKTLSIYPTYVYRQKKHAGFAAQTVTMRRKLGYSVAVFLFAKEPP